jgi:hypothetical protein
LIASCTLCAADTGSCGSNTRLVMPVSAVRTLRGQGSAATDFYTWTKSVYLGLDQ